jgi:hypothetical protein
MICVLLGYARVELVAVQKTRVLDKAEEETRKRPNENHIQPEFIV